MRDDPLGGLGWNAAAAACCLAFRVQHGGSGQRENGMDLGHGGPDSGAVLTVSGSAASEEVEVGLG